MERCDECGFEYDTATYATVSTRIVALVGAIGQQLRASGQAVSVRPQPDRWCSLEYAAHVRDVVSMMRERIVIGLVEDNPTFAPMYRDQRVSMGLYAADTVDSLEGELEGVAAMLGRFFDALSAEQLARPVRYGFPDPLDRTVGWMGLQAVHEATHHSHDIAHNLA